MVAPKKRIYELSKELGVSNKDLMTLLQQEFGLEPKSHSSSIEHAHADKLKEIIQQRKSGKPAGSPAAPTATATLAAPTAVETKVETKVEPKAAPAQPQAPAQQRPPQQPAATGQRAPEQARTATPQRPQVGTQRGPDGRPQGAPQHAHQGQQQQRPGAQQGYGQQGQGPRPQHPQQGPHGPQHRHAPAGGGNMPNRGPGQASPAAATTQGQQRPGGFNQNQQQRGGNRPGGQHGRNQGRSHGGPAVKREAELAPQAVIEAPPKIVKITETLTVGELAQKLDLRETEIIKHLFMKGVMVTVNQTLDPTYAKTIAKEMGYEVEEVAHPALQKTEYNPALLEKKGKLDASKFKHLQGRPPVVSIMGHVDHGKTSLLDAIRETRHKIVEQEAGGITQSIGAYTVEKNGEKIVFLDTPGHEAFTSMRMRGAKATDIAILVVAADDGVMPQTIEAINHAKAAEIPIIVAVNKIDKPGADPEKVLVQLADHGLVSEKWGGDTVMVEVSALQKLGLDDLLEMILLVSELLELKADPTVPGEGVIIEAQLDKRKGPVATALVQNGTLKIGENILIGAVGGRVRALISDSGERVIKAGPATPVEILGLDDVPKAGDHFQVIRDEKKFKQMLSAEKIKERSERLNQGFSARSQGFSARHDGGEQEDQHDFNLIVKADTQGSAEAVNNAVIQLSTDEIKVKLVHSGTGDISEADVMLASASNALIIGFNVKEDINAQRITEQSGVKILTFDVIYHITEEVEKLMLGKLSPETQEIEAGQAEVRQIFTVGKNVVIAGCMVTKGKVIRNAKAKVTRNGKEVFTGPLDNLKRFKDDAKEVAAGYECGISFSKFNDIQVGDIVTVYTVEETERTSL